MERNNKGQFIKGTNGNTYNGYGVWYDKKGYPCICLCGKDTKLHLYIWELENGQKPGGYDLHHKDYDKGNYNLENLELLSKSDHMKVHAGWKRDDKGNWTTKPCKDCKLDLPLLDFYQRKGFTPSNICKKCTSIYYKHLRENPEFRENKKVYLKEYYQKIKRNEK